MTEWKNLSRWEIRDDKSVYAEFGSSSNFRFLDPENVSMIDAEGNVMYCKCGKKATTALIGEDSFINQCSDCMFGEKHD